VKYFIGIIIVVISFVFSDVILRMLMSYWYIIFPVLTVIYFYVVTSVPKPYEFSGSQKVLLISRWIVKIVWTVMITLFVLLILRVLLGGLAENNHPSITKKLNIAMKDNNPCFYVEPFEGMEAFDLYKVHVLKPPEPYERYWCVGLCENKKITIPLSLFTGTEQCISYGIKNKTFSASSKGLEIDVLYEASIDASRRDIPKGKEENGNWLTADVWFYLSKNPKTGEINATELSLSQANAWIKNMDDNNKSIETTKEKK
jgi:hypothetical protein